MAGVALTTREKQVVPSLHLNTSANKLNDYVKKTHAQLKHEETIKRHKAKEPIKNAIKFKKEFNKLKNTKMNFHKPVSEKESKEECNTKYLGRIMTCFEQPEIKDKELRISDIKDFTLMNNGILNDGLKFLVRYGIIKERRDKGYFYYSK